MAKTQQTTFEDPVLTEAVKRVEHDQGNGFYAHPFELAVQQHAPGEWLGPIWTQLSAGDYVPRAASTFDVPKPHWHVRPAAMLSLEDTVVYSWLGLTLRPFISPLLEKSAGTVRFSHIGTGKGHAWFQPPFVGWNAFRERSLELCHQFPYVLITDIAGYFENIEIGRLIIDLQALGAPKDAVTTLSKCLNKWADPRRRGIPQGYTPSDLLAELYLDAVDKHLQTDGIVHVRYMDDIRIFSPDEWRARRSLHRLTAVLRDRGLNLQTAKSKIVTAEEAQKTFNGLVNVIQDVGSKLVQEAIAAVPDVEYLDWSEVREYLDVNPSSPPVDVVKEAWSHFAAGSLGPFDKSVFHFLLNRLADAHQPDAVPYVLNLLTIRPDETDACLGYLGDLLPLEPELVHKLSQTLSSPTCIYEYQRYQILSFLLSHSIIDPHAVAFARASAKGTTHERLVRPYALAYLGLSGEMQDYDILQARYKDSENWVERLTITCAMRNAPEAIRSTFYGRIAGEHSLIDRAIAWAKKNKGK